MDNFAELFGDEIADLKNHVKVSLKNDRARV
jgi:hypothetical protein